MSEVDKSVLICWAVLIATYCGIIALGLLGRARGRHAKRKGICVE